MPAIPTVAKGGFTLDSSTREEYLRKPGTLETYSRLSGRPYQSQIKDLMKAWLVSE